MILRRKKTVLGEKKDGLALHIPPIRLLHISDLNFKVSLSLSHQILVFSLGLACNIPTHRSRERSVLNDQIGGGGMSTQLRDTQVAVIMICIDYDTYHDDDVN